MTAAIYLIAITPHLPLDLLLPDLRGDARVPIPQIAFWFLPAVIGSPITLYVLWTHPLVKANQ
jgi:hypothetical protein